MKGFVPTPEATVDAMVDRLFQKAQPSKASTVLDPGSGEGAFVEGVLRWCRRNRAPLPRIIAVESDPKHVKVLRSKFGTIGSVEVRQADFLLSNQPKVDYVIGNPPYVAITGLSESEKAAYRERFETAAGRFDLYILFFERALRLLNPGGRLVFITPEKFLYVGTAEPLRGILRRLHVSELKFVAESTFEGYVTYPAITTIDNVEAAEHETSVELRDGKVRKVALPAYGSWLSTVLGVRQETSRFTLADVCLRVSCGVATGADSVYVVKNASLGPDLTRYAYPTIAGRELPPTEAQPVPRRADRRMLIPYDREGKLLSERDLGPLRAYLREEARRRKLLARTCVARKPWYAFHETPQLDHILRPKILCKDIVAKPFFVADMRGHIVPRHTVYYIVPKDPRHLTDLLDYLNSQASRRWLAANCQRAANGYLRLQSHVLKKLPVPERFAPKDARAGRELNPA